jgi:hypothetical protein
VRKTLFLIAVLIVACFGAATCIACLFGPHSGGTWIVLLVSIVVGLGAGVMLILGAARGMSKIGF